MATSPTQVAVTFDRVMAASSLQAARFSIPGLNVDAAALNVANSRQVLLGTDAQTGGTAYTVTVSNAVDDAVTDTLDKAVAEAAKTADFTGYVPLAGLLLNEINPNLSALDLIELKVLTAGTLNGIVLKQNPMPSSGGAATFITLPNVLVAQGDLVVVHLGATSLVNETAKDGCNDPVCYATAWDFFAATKITYGYRLLAAVAPDGTLLDAVPFYTQTTQGDFPANVQYAQGLGHWLPADCGGAPCTFLSDPTVQSVSFDWTGIATTVGGNSAQRKTTGDTNTAADWFVGASSFGLANTNP
jgi:hypothetical protein